MRRWIAVCLVLVCAGAVFLFLRQSGLPSDQDMIAHFRTHRAELEKLVVMIHSDRGLQRVDGDWTRPADPSTIGLTAARIDAYRTILRSIALPRGFESLRDGKEIDFITHTKGISVSGSAKSFVWSESGDFRDAPLVPDLDAVWKKRIGKLWHYRHIEGPWYLHLRAD